MKVFNDNLYELDNQQGKIQILHLSEPNRITTSYYRSKLENIEEPILDLTVDNQDRASGIYRSTIMSNAKSFHSNFEWSCDNKNLSYLSNWKKPRYVGNAGDYKYMPYCWGGFSSTSQYEKGMDNGGRVGNINTSTTSHVSNTYGIDCSGYVSRCWGQTSKYGTYTIMDIAYEINASNLLKGDALNKSSSHIVLFEKYDGYGNYVLYEATLLNGYDRVSHTSRSVSSLSDYVPIRYSNVK